jgi:hypothetical protein
MAPDRILILSHVLYKIRINRITIQQIVQPVQVIQINHLRAAAILQEQHLRVVVIQQDHHHVVVPTALLRVIQEVHAHRLQVLTRLQATAATAVEVLQVRAVAVVALEARVAVQVVAHQVAAEDN